MESAHAVATSQAAQKGKLLQILGVSFGIAVTIGATIGLGILRTPGTVAAHLGNFWLIISIWIAGGIYSLFSAISIAELGTSLPRAGGWYVYARRAFGDYGGVIVGWSDWLSGCAGQAFVAIAISEYMTILVPALSSSVKGIGIATLILLGLLNFVGLRVGSRAQEWRCLPMSGLDSNSLTKN